MARHDLLACDLAFFVHPSSGPPSAMAILLVPTDIDYASDDGNTTKTAISQPTRDDDVHQKICLDKSQQWIGLPRLNWASFKTKN
jgi:hypothetical protein